MEKTNLIKLSLSVCSLMLYMQTNAKVFDELNKDNLKTQYSVAKIVITKGAVGASDLVVQGAIAAKNAIASSIEQGQIAVEKAKAEYAQNEMKKVKNEAELLKKEIQSLKQEIESLKASLKHK